MNWIIECDIFEDRKINDKYKGYFEYVSGVFSKLINEEPPANPKTLQLKYSKTGFIVHAPIHLDKIKLGFNLKPEDIPEAIFQFTYMLCHIHVNPDVNNWFIESVCNMSGLYMNQYLSEAEGLEKDGLSNEMFRDYFNHRLREAFSHIDHVQNQHSSNWIKREVAKINCKNTNTNPGLIHNIAYEILPSFTKNKELWQALGYFGKATHQPPHDEISDFLLPSIACPDFEKLKLILPENLKEITNDMIGRIWGSPDKQTIEESSQISN